MRDRWLTPDAPASGYVCRTLRIPNGEEFLAAVNGALNDLARSFNWEQAGALTPAETAELFYTMYEDYRESRGCVLGTIFTHALAAAPAGSLACDGASHLRVDYPDLYGALDPIYHIDADNFRTPDLRGRSAVGVGQGAGLTNRALDASGGEETHTLTIAELASHSHNYALFIFAPLAVGPGPLLTAVNNIPQNTTFTGGDTPHNTMHPFRALHYAIWAR